MCKAMYCYGCFLLVSFLKLRTLHKKNSFCEKEKKRGKKCGPILEEAHESKSRKKEEEIKIKEMLETSLFHQIKRRKVLLKPWYLDMHCNPAFKTLNCKWHSRLRKTMSDYYGDFYARHMANIFLFVFALYEVWRAHAEMRTFLSKKKGRIFAIWKKYMQNMKKE